MKRFLLLAMLSALLPPGCAHNPYPASPAATLAPRYYAQTAVPAVFHAEEVCLESPNITAASPNERSGLDSGSGDSYFALRAPASERKDVEDKSADAELEGEQEVSIADPLEPFNRAMFHFNDKLYFWVLKPVAQGYNKIVPEGARISVQNFFSNLGFPIRFLSCLLQADFSGAATELGRFTVNTVWGIGGLLDPSSGKELNLQKQEADMGQTLGIYGVGQGFYIVWPFIGPSSARDSIDIAGEYFLYPVSYIRPWYAWLGVRGYEDVNYTSLRIGDYESLKETAIDPYVALRNAYAQYRLQKIKAKKSLKPAPSRPGGVTFER
ncbi:MAG: VacJ family lipoprotein [Syntrophales bacterium]